MPQRRRQQNKTRRQRVPPRRRRTTRTNNSVSVVIKTITLKTRHNKEEIYPIPLNEIISRANVGDDVDIHALGYSLSVSFATGNDMATVTANVGHSGPWVRRGQSAKDTFNQQSREHDFKRNKTVVFKKNMSISEREYINPDTTDNYINLRIRDPCGVIPGVTVKMECRFRLKRPIPSTTFLDAGTVASDLYEDQDVNNGTSSGQPQPPAALQDIPKVIAIQSFVSTSTSMTTSSTVSPYVYTSGDVSYSFTITVAGKVNKVGVITFDRPDNPNIQKDYTADGYEGTIVAT